MTPVPDPTAGRALRAVGRLHVLVFRHPMSAEMESFLRHLSWSVLGGFLSAGVLFAATVIAGRVLGPAEYGRVSLILVLSQAFALLGAVGLDVASARMVPRIPPADRPRYVSTSAAGVLVTLTLSAALFAAVAPVIAGLAGTTSATVRVAVLAGVVLGVRTLLERQIAALEHFRAQSFVRIVEALVVVSLVVAFLFPLDRRGALWVVVALNAGALVLIVLQAIVLRRFLRPRAADRRTVRDLSRYARIALLHAVTPIGFVYGDRLVVHDELGAEGLGIYSAYYAASYTVVTLLLGVTANVLFPAAARLDDKRPLLAKLRRTYALAAVPTVLGLMAVTYVVLQLFGDRYPFSPLTAALFGAWGSLLLLNGLLTVLTVTHSERTYLLTALLQGLRSVVFVGYLLAIVALDLTSVRTVLAGMIAIEVLEVVNLSTILRRHVVMRAASADAGGRAAGG